MRWHVISWLLFETLATPTTKYLVHGYSNDWFTRCALHAYYILVRKQTTVATEATNELFQLLLIVSFSIANNFTEDKWLLRLVKSRYAIVWIDTFAQTVKTGGSSMMKKRNGQQHENYSRLTTLWIFFRIYRCYYYHGWKTNSKIYCTESTLLEEANYFFVPN